MVTGVTVLRTLRSASGIESSDAETASRAYRTARGKIAAVRINWATTCTDYEANPTGSSVAGIPPWEATVESLPHQIPVGVFAELMANYGDVGRHRCAAQRSAGARVGSVHGEVLRHNGTT
jgi:hypothetical protein